MSPGPCGHTVQHQGREYGAAVGRGEEEERKPQPYEAHQNGVPGCLQVGQLETTASLVL